MTSKEDRKAQRNLDEMRKAGTIPAQKDELGKDINPHMPKYISAAPWYLNKSQPTLTHQKKENTPFKTEITNWYQRGQFQNQIQHTKFRKGACQNCGAMTHQKKDCMDRPRQVGAERSGKDIKPDEHIKDIKFDYDSQRDRWNGYDPKSYHQVIEEHEAFELTKRQQMMNQEQSNAELLNNAEINNNNNNVDTQIDQELKKKDFENDAPVNCKDPKIKTSTKNLRIREDPAKYLYNLDPNSAHYDPKSRSMRQDPNFPGSAHLTLFKGDKEWKNAGEEAQTLLRQELLAWEHVESTGAIINTIGMPTATEKLYKGILKTREVQKRDVGEKLTNKYGDQNDIDNNQQNQSQINLTHEDGKSLIGGGETTSYVEFTREGKVKHPSLYSQNANIAYQNRTKQSKYEEDKFVKNHTAVWGSYWNEVLGWGYGCCHSDDRQSVCLGEHGKKKALQKQYRVEKQRQIEMESAIAQLQKDDANNNTTQSLQQQQQQEESQDEQFKLQQVKDNLSNQQNPKIQEASEMQIEPQSPKMKPPKTKPNIQKQQQQQIQAKNNVEKSASSSSISSSDSDTSSESSELTDSSSEISSSQSTSSAESNGSSSSEISNRKSKRKKDKFNKKIKHAQNKNKKENLLNKSKNTNTKNDQIKRLKSKEGEKDIVLDPKKLKKALLEEERRRSDKGAEEKDERKRTYNSFSKEIYNKDKVDPEQIEAYRLKQQKFGDPLHNMLK